MAMTEDQMQRALANALSRNPAGNLQQTAKSAGISKTTLYRFASTREALLDMLRAEGIRRTRVMYDRSDLESAPPLEAITRLAENLLTEREFCAFLITDYEMQQSYWVGTNDWAIEWKGMEQRLEDVFVRGQKAGIFRVELPATWLTDVFNLFLYGVVDSERRGRIAPAYMFKLWQTTFMAGAGVSAER